MKFVLDANVLIEAHRRYYSFDIVPSFWATLLRLASTGNVFTIKPIQEEICHGGGDDHLSTWMNSEFIQWCEKTDDPKILKAYAEIINWAYAQPQYTDAAKTEFARVGDSWLIAYALAYGCTIVTHEQYKAEVKKRILIPNVCRAFNIPHIDTFSMLRTFSAKLG